MEERFIFKIDKIVLKNRQEIIPQKINVIIGPNNAGKSKLLREIASFFWNTKERNVIISDIDFYLPDNLEKIKNDYNIEKKSFESGSSKYIYNDSNLEEMAIIYSEYSWKEKNKHIFLKKLGQIFINYLGTKQRLTMIEMKEFINGINSNTLSIFRKKVMQDDNCLKNLYKNAKNLFNRDMYLDTTTQPGFIKFKVGEDLSYYKNAKKEDYKVEEAMVKENDLDFEGDGLKSFTSMFLSLEQEDKNIILIDEPEAFLYPPLARQLGEIIAEKASKEKQIFIVTHSTEFLKGIISKCDDAQIIRITRNGNINSIVRLEDKGLEEILKEPKLRVSKALEGLFCNRVIITEAEADEIFYQELLEKINPQSGIYFSSAGNKQVALKMASLYSKMKMNFAMILDFDIFRNDDEAAKLLRIANIEEKERQRYLKIIRDLIAYMNKKAEQDLDECKEKDELKKKKKGELYHKNGLRAVENTELRIEVKGVIDELYKYNIIILSTGELESVLENIGLEYSSNKIAWVEKALQYINKNSAEELRHSDISKLLLGLFGQE